MSEYPYGTVQLTGGPIKQHFDRIHALYLALDNDRLLKVFRQRAGLPAPGPDMGGWYDSDGFVPGLTLGQYISGLARFGAATGDKAAHAKVARLVSGFGEFIRRAGNPYAGPNAQAQWAAYAMDKYVVGACSASWQASVWYPITQILWINNILTESVAGKFAARPTACWWTPSRTADGDEPLPIWRTSRSECVYPPAGARALSAHSTGASRPPREAARVMQ